MESPEQPVTTNPELKRASVDEGQTEAPSEKKQKIDADANASADGGEPALEAVVAESSTQAQSKGKGKKDQSRRAARNARQQDREQGRRGGTRAEGGEADEEGEKGPRLPKRQCALLLGFCGSAYNGMQMYVPENQNDFRFITYTRVIDKQKCVPSKVCSLRHSAKLVLYRKITRKI